jgi:serine/threonine protein kinase
MPTIIKLSPKITYNPFKKKIKLAFNRRYNIITIDNIDYELKYLNEYKGSKGGNSNVFLLANPNEPDNEDQQLVIKFTNLPLEKAPRVFKRRFVREVIALRRAKKEKNESVIAIEHVGIAEISGYQYPFYCMEKADNDLANFLSQNKISIDQKLLLCQSIIQGFKELNNLQIYHRDIKHDNIFVVANSCKIGDLGLIKFRDDDYDFIQNEKGERIGAFGWESPETMNKYLTERNGSSPYDCEIDHQSDIFQLGKLFWYIFQGNLPIGQVIKEDFVIDDNDIFLVLFQMLQYSKKVNRRFISILDVEEKFNLLLRKYYE